MNAGSQNFLRIHNFSLINLKEINDHTLCDKKCLDLITKNFMCKQNTLHRNAATGSN